MRTSQNGVPLIPLKDFGSSPFLEHGIFIEAFEDCVSVRHKRMEVHRHDYVELFWLQGYGSVLIDFEIYPLSGKSLIAIGPGRVHAWHVKKLIGLYIGFTQEFFDGSRPPPSALFDYPFVFGGEVSPVVRLKPKQGEQAQNLFGEINQEFQKHENLAVDIRLLTSTEEPYPMRIEKKIVLAGGTAGIGWAAARISPAKRSSWTVAARLIKATRRRYKPNLPL
jgi:hypothetical protein